MDALPSFILGYHGCNADVAEGVFAGKHALEPSDNDYDWLGPGIYFWEHNAARAFEFAKAMRQRPHPSSQDIEAPAVVGAIIDLGHCLNLLDSEYIQLVKEAYSLTTDTHKRADLELPRNTGGSDLVDRKLDCAVIRTLHEKQKEDDLKDFDTVRAAFIEGEKLYPDAGFAAKNHLQIAVCNPRCIKGCFRPLDDNGNPMTFK